ncbi:MAG: hypothetical protein KGL90_15380 [Burkholderiales bacterium]|nr:hypothetical protein [Burkholderiales bacterium]
MRKQIYQCDSDGIWDGLEKFAKPDPNNDGDWLIPGGCTDIDPPVIGEKQAAIFKDGTWSIVDDFRGMVFWLPTGERAVITHVATQMPPGALDHEPSPPPPTEAQLEAEAAAAVAGMLDALAMAWQYSSYQSARTYKGDINPKFNAEGSALANFGSACYSVLDDIQAGKVARPTDVDGLLALMPPKPTRPVV